MSEPSEAGPRRTRRARTPLFPQTEQSECGAACLGSVLGHYGQWASPSRLRDACRIGRDGCSASDILRAARLFGLEAKGWRRNLSTLHETPLPAIVFWEFNHFVVLEGIGKDRFHLNDPAIGHVTVDRETFDRAFTGIVLQLTPGAGFTPGPKPPGTVARLWQWQREFRPAAILAAVIGLLLSLVSLVLALLLAVLIDHVLILGQASWGPVMVGLMGGLAVLTWLLAWLQARTLRRLATGVAIEQSDRFLSHLFRLPVSFFSHRLAGDLVSRVRTINRLSREGAARMVQVSAEAASCLVFLAAMLAFDPFLALTILGLVVLWSAPVFVLSRLRADSSFLLRREQGLLAGLVMSGMRVLQPIRAAAGESSYFARWGGYQANEINARQAFEELGHVIDALPGLFIMLGSALVLGIGGWKVAGGDMTLGALMGFFVLSGCFLRPIGLLMTFVNELHLRAADLSRLDDVLDTPAIARPDDTAGRARSRTPTLEGRMRLTGRLELRDVTFGFQPGKPPLIRNFNLTLHPGERIAIVGPSGSGKTALASLVAGIHEPWSGEILYDGHRIGDIPAEVFMASVGIVDQQPMLFAASVRDNLTFWNPTVEDARIVAAARDAAIHEAISARPGGYESPVHREGRNFSGGQQQKLEIARALVTDPSILILDEATSSLDTLSELQIDRNLRRRGCACLIVAHRLGTIRDSDLIVVMQAGREVQRGRHEALMAVDGPYRRLVDAR